jgi:hypothetical protein
MFDERSSPLGPREIPGVEFNIKSSMYGVEAYIAMIFEKIYNNVKSDSLDLFREDKKYIIFLGSGISAEVFGYEDIVIEVTEVLKRHSEYKDKIIYIIDNDYPEELKEKIKEKFMDFFNGGAKERKKLIEYLKKNDDLLSAIILKLHKMYKIERESESNRNILSDITKEFHKYCRSKNPTLAHYIVANIFKFRSFPFKNEVITTNWDIFLEMALEECRLRNIKKYGKKDAPEENGAEVIIYKVHGDLSEDFASTDDELVFFDGWNLYCTLNDINPEFEKRIEWLISKNPILFIGYSGKYDDHIINILKTNDEYHISIRKSHDSCPITEYSDEIHCNAEMGLFLLLTKLYQKDDFLHLLKSILCIQGNEAKFLTLINKLQSNANHIFKNEQDAKSNLQMLERWIVNGRIG